MAVGDRVRIGQGSEAFHILDQLVFMDIAKPSAMVSQGIPQGLGTCCTELHGCHRHCMPTRARRADPIVRRVIRK